MNVQHKCLFHPSNPIAKFCENKQCTLPLCLECEPIHLQQHHSQQSQAKIMRFNEATLKAANNMEDYLQAFKAFERETENKMENDKEVVLKIIEEYYSTARKMVSQIRNNVENVTENLNKLNKGSIKALIFYYSGDVKLNKFNLQFEPLQVKIRNLLQRKQVKTNNVQKPVEDTYQDHHYSVEPEQKYANHSSDIILDKQRTKNMRNIQSQGDNIFSSIQQIKEDKVHSRNRKSIFDQNKKGSGVNHNTIAHKQVETKYNYQPQYENLLPQNTTSAIVEPSPKFHYDINYQYREYEKTSPQPEILSFQNRFLNKFANKEHQQMDYKDYLPSAKEFSRPQAKYDEVFNKKLLKPEDLDLQKENSNFGGKATISHTLTQRNRSMSQNHMNMNEKEVKKTSYEYDLKRQVLSPDEIRKMLQKKIQERNRVLSIKKADNYPIPQQKGRKGWETRDSIINQIYSEPKY